MKIAFGILIACGLAILSMIGAVIGMVVGLIFVPLLAVSYLTGDSTYGGIINKDQDQI